MIEEVIFRRQEMAAKDRMAVLTAMMDQSVIPVFYHPDVELCKDVIQACANGGAITQSIMVSFVSAPKVGDDE